jgi:hypothetical protein
MKLDTHIHATPYMYNNQLDALFILNLTNIPLHHNNITNLIHFHFHNQFIVP